MQQEKVKHKYSVRDNVSGEYIVEYGPNFVNMGDKADRLIFTEKEAFEMCNALEQFDDTKPEVIEEN